MEDGKWKMWGWVFVPFFFGGFVEWVLCRSTPNPQPLPPSGEGVPFSGGRLVMVFCLRWGCAWVRPFGEGGVIDTRKYVSTACYFDGEQSVLNL